MKPGKKCFFALAMLSTVAVHAAEYYWTYAGEGDWNDGSKWHKGTVSGATGTVPGFGDHAHLYTNCTVNIDGECEVSQLFCDSGSAAFERVCTLKGSGRLLLKPEAVPRSEKSSVTTFQISQYTTLIMDGPDVYNEMQKSDNASAVQYCEGGTLIVKRGTYTPVTHYIKTAPGRLVIDGGTVTGYDAELGQHSSLRAITVQNGWSSAGAPVGFIDLKGGLLDVRLNLHVGTFTMTGGVWDRSKVTQAHYFPALATRDNLSVNIEGGEKVVMHAYDSVIDNDTRFFAVDELVYKNPTVGYWRPISESGVYKFNVIDAPSFTPYLTNDNVELSGESLNLRSFEMSSAVHELAFNVSTVKVNNAARDLYVFGSVNTLSLPVHLYSHRKLHFSSAASIKAWFLWNLYNHDTFWRFHEGLDASTTADDGTSAVSYAFYSLIFDQGATLDFHGVGDVKFTLNNYAPSGHRNEYSGFSNQLARISMTGGGQMEFSNWSWNARDYPMQTERFVLGPGSKLVTHAATYAHLDANEVEMDASSELIINADSQNAYYFPPSPIMTGPRHVNDFQTPESRPTVSLTTATASNEWNFAWINGQPVFWFTNVSQRADCNISRTYLSKWRGTVDGNWSNPANWLIDTGKDQAADPLEQAMVFDGGYTNTRITVDSAVKAYQIYVLNKTAPVAFVGNGSIALGYSGRDNVAMTAYGGSSAIGTMSDHPVVFDVPVSLSDTITVSRYFTVNQNSRAYVAFMKSLDGGEVFTIKGDVRIGGAATAKNILFNEQVSAFPAKRTRLSIIPGGSFTATRQDWMQSGANVEIYVYSNATFTVQNPSEYTCFWGSNYERRPIWVKEFGKFDCRAPLGGATKVSFKGKGEVRLADTGSRATADYPVELEDVTFAIDSFAAGHPIVLKGSPTWVSRVDWTYSLGPVSLPAGETLTVDTGDLDTGAGHSTAINSAVTADKLVKKGAGTLALGSSGNALGEVSVEAGKLFIAASQSFGSLVVASGAGLQVASGATVALSGSVDFTGVTVAAAVGKYWTTVLTVPEGSSINGVQADNTQPFMMRVVESDAGLALQMRRRHGETISFR